MNEGAETPAEAHPAGQRDLTTGPIGSTLMLFALPTLGANILQSLNGSINAVWIGRFLGEDALAATSNANLIMFFMFAAVFGFGMAATIIIGQNIGRRDIDAARRALGTTLGLFLGISVIIAAAGWLLAEPVLRALATPPEALPLALDYIRVMFLTIPATFVTVLLTMGLRGTGDSMTPLWIMLLTVILDAGLNPVFILGLGPAPEMGIAGSATATLVAGAIALVCLLVAIYTRDLTIRLRGAELSYLLPDRAILGVVVRKGLPMGLQMVVISSAMLAMIGLINREGVVVTAGYAVAQTLWTYVQMPAMALGAAVSAMAAQNIGAGKWDRVGKITGSGILYSVLLTGAMVLLITIFDRQLVALFLGAGSPAIPVAEHIHLVAGWCFIPLGVAFIFFGVVRANGSVIGPLIILFIAMFPMRVGVAMLLRPIMGIDALWWSFPIGTVACMLMTIAHYQHGGWRKIRMLEEPAG